MILNDLPALLENRTDLEKLEQDLAAVDAVLPELQLSNEILELVRKARRELEIERAVHIALYYRLGQRSDQERIAARDDLLQRIAAGEMKFYDPQASSWRSAAQLLVDFNQRNEELSRREAAARRLEARLQTVSESPYPLSTLYKWITQVEDLENQDELSAQGSLILQKARQIYEAGQQNHRELTLMIRNGTLTERFRAIGLIRDLITLGETQILEAPSDMWRPAAQVLEEAVTTYEQESGRVATFELTKAEDRIKNNPQMALKSLYLALDKNIPYTPVDRQRLENRYMELLQNYGQPSDPAIDERVQIFPEDREGYQKVSEMNCQRLKALYRRSAEWLNRFLNSALTQTPAILLKEAYDKVTPIEKTTTLIDMAVTIARKQLSVSIEIPEVMVRGAGILFEKGQVEQASTLLAQAKPLYTLERSDKIHRHAVTCWLAGCLDYYQGRRLRGYSEWKEARGLFADLKNESTRKKQNDRIDWYQTRLLEMDTLVIQTYEEVYFQWMNQVDPIAFTGSLAEYRKMMDSQFGYKQYVELRETIQVLLKEGYAERAPEISWLTLIEASFFEYQMGDYCDAISHLDVARVGFHQGHRHAVTLWLLGMIRWWMPSQRSQAIKNWEDSIEEFKYLADQANKTNRIKHQAWYDNQVSLMSNALKQWISITRP